MLSPSELDKQLREFQKQRWHEQEETGARELEQLLADLSGPRKRKKKPHKPR